MWDSSKTRYTNIAASTHECTVCLPDSIPEQFTFRISPHGCNGLPYTFMGFSGLWLWKYLSKTQKLSRIWSQMGQFLRKWSQIKCSHSFNSCSKHLKLGRRVLQTLNHALPTGFAFKLSGWNMRSTLSTWYRCESHPKPGTRTLLLVRMNVRCVFQTQFQNNSRSGSLHMGAMDFHTRSWGSADSGCENICRKPKNYPESGHKWVNFWGN